MDPQPTSTAPPAQADRVFRGPARARTRSARTVAQRMRSEGWLPAVVLVLIGCVPVAPEPVSVACAEIQPAAADAPGSEGDTAIAAATVGPADTLDLFVILDSVPPGPGSVGLWVNGLAEPGIVRFFQPPATAMALTPLPSFQGCAPAAARGTSAARGPLAPHGKAWVRVSTDRTVRLRVTIQGGRPTTQPALVDPGASGVARWSAAP